MLSDNSLEVCITESEAWICGMWIEQCVSFALKVGQAFGIVTTDRPRILPRFFPLSFPKPVARALTRVILSKF